MGFKSAFKGLKGGPTTLNKTDNVGINVVLRRVRVTIVAVKKAMSITYY
jgi:hypothetical protein